MPVRLTIAQGPHAGLARTEILRRARVVFVALQLGKAELSIVLTDDAQIHELNKTYRHKDRPTDVLAFAMREGELGHADDGLLGDVIISVETARKQAEKAGVALLDEVTMLMTHGILHLLGWDHETDAKDRLMRAETDRLLAIVRDAPVQRARKRARMAGRRRPVATSARASRKR